MSEEIAERKFNWTYAEGNRIGNHIWWISDNSKFSSHYPDWKMKYKTLNKSYRRFMSVTASVGLKKARMIQQDKKNVLGIGVNIEYNVKQILEEIFL